MENRFNVEVVRLPYEINGIQLLAPKDSSQVNVPQRKYSFSEKGLHMPIGSRGIRELAKHQQNSSDAVAPKAADEPLKIVTLHRKGILAVWDCCSHQLLGVCDHGGNVNVEECSTTKDFIITRVVCSPGHDALEEDNNLYIWDADTTEKVATLRGHHGRVTTYALHATNKNVVVTAGMDSVMFVWDLSKNYDEPIQKIDIRDMGGILTCSTIVKDYIICGGTTRSVGVWNIATGQLLALTDNVPSSTTAIHVVEETHSNTEDTLLTVHAASTDGFIAELQVRISGGGAAAAITPVWKNQYHTASATSIAVDGDVVVSCSTFDGVKIFHRKTGIHRVVGAKGERRASRAFVLDSANKKILVGQDDGALCELSYSAFAAQTSKNLDMISVVHPLTTAITGILIEVSAGNVWERVLCSSVDGVVSILDYSFQSRSTESVNCVRLASQQFVGKLGDGVVGVVPPDRIAEVDFLDVRRLNKVAKSVSLSSPVTALTADVERALCVVGCKNGNVTVFQFANDEARAAAEWSFKHYRVTYIAKHLSGVFAVGFSREDEFTGGVSVLNMHTPTVGSAKPLELDRSIPAVVYMLGHHSVVAQGTDNAIILLQYDSTTLALSTSRKIGTAGLPRSLHVRVLPQVAQISFLDAKFGISRFTVTATAAEPQKALTMAAKEDVLASGVTSLSFLCQPDAEFAVSFNASPDVFFMNDKGSVAMVVKPTGAVHKPIEESSRRYSRHVEYTSEAEEQRQGLTCCDMTFNETRRFLVMGYSNGLVQLLDTSYQYIFLRVAPHERITSAVHTFSFDQTVFAAFSAGKEAVKLVPYIVKKRNIMDSKE